MKSLDGRVAVITGAGGGVGRSLALAMARHGAHIALVDIRRDAIAQTRALIDSPALRVSEHCIDITDKSAMSQLPQAVLAEHGQVNILVNNAGITYQKSFDNHSLEDWERIVGVNWWGMLYSCHFFMDALKASGEGHIVNLSSMNAFVGLASQTSYCATKAAVRLFSESLWAELRQYNIGVTSVHPGAIKTEMMKATLGDADDAAVALKTYALVQKIGVSPDKVAKRIIAAIVKDKLRIRIGADAVVMDVLKRCFPVGLQRLLAGIG